MILDVNVWFGAWHKQKFKLNSLNKLDRHLKNAGINRALISSADAVFCNDPEAWNEELIENISRYHRFIPAPVFKPTLANWEQILSCYSTRAVKVLRLLPGYHSYSLLSPKLEPVFKTCAEYKYNILIQMRMDDERNHHLLVQPPAVDVGEIIGLAAKFPDLTLVCLCAYFKEVVQLCSGSKNIYADISFVEQMNTIAGLLEKTPASRVVFGTHTPFLYTEAALLKMEHAEIPRKKKERIFSQNACSLMKIADDY